MYMFKGLRSESHRSLVHACEVSGGEGVLVFKEEKTMLKEVN